VDQDGSVIAGIRREQVLAFRATGHGLGRRRPAGDLAGAAGAIGLRRTKHTAVALAARVEGVAAGDLERALEAEVLAVVYGARGTLMVVPAAGVEVFTRGTAPAGEASLRAAVPGAFLRQLDAAGMTVAGALEAVVDAVRDALAGGPRPRGETAMAVTRALPGVLSPPCRGRCPDPHVEDSLFRLAGVVGTMRFVGATDDLVAMGGPVLSGEEARAELVRRFLRCYGPATPATLAEWAGISVDDARRSLDQAAPVTVTDGAVAGVRFLPAYDPWLLDRDRATLVPDPDARRVLWRAAGSPGLVLVDAEPAAAWRTSTKGGRLTLRLQPLAGGPAVEPAAVHNDAQRVGAALGAEGTVAVEVDG
jgi:hypothetical protein